MAATEHSGPFQQVGANANGNIMVRCEDCGGTFEAGATADTNDDGEGGDD